MIRLLLICLYLILWLTIGQIIYFIIFIIGKICGEKTYNKLMLSYVKIVASHILFIAGVHLHIEGLENIPENESVLYIANHRSDFDSLIAYTLVKNETGFIAKIELEKILPIKIWIQALNGFLIDRNDIRQSFKVIISAIEKIKNNISIWIFPEGTRCKSKNKLDMLEFKEGSFKIAEKTNCYIIPIAILNSNLVFEEQKPFIKSADVYVKIGEKFKITDVEEENRKEIGNWTRNIILNMLEDINAKH